MSQPSDAATTLADLALCVDALLMESPNMANSRELVLRYQDGVAQETIGAIADRLPTDPNNPNDWTDLTLNEINGNSPSLTCEQTAAALVALHAVHCQGIEVVVANPAELPEDASMDDWMRAVQWLATLDRVRSLGDYALHWFKLQFRRFEQILSHATAQRTPPASEETPARSASPTSAPPGGVAKKRKIPKTEAQTLVDHYLMEHGKPNPFAVTIAAIAKATGVSTGGVQKTRAWRAFEAERKRLHPSGKVRAVQLRDEMLAVASDTHASDPAEIAAQKELARLADINKLEQDQNRDKEADERHRKRPRS